MTMGLKASLDCRACEGKGLVKDPARGWKFWRLVKCEECNGSGRFKPPHRLPAPLTFPPRGECADWSGEYDSRRGRR